MPTWLIDGIGRQRRGDRLRGRRGGLRVTGSWTTDAAGLGGQAGHPVGVGAGIGIRILPPGGRKLRIAASVTKCPQPCSARVDVLVRHCRRRCASTRLRDTQVERAEIVVPRGEILREGRTHFGPRRHGTRDQQQHDDILSVSPGRALRRSRGHAWHVTCHGGEIHPTPRSAPVGSWRGHDGRTPALPRPHSAGLGRDARTKVCLPACDPGAPSAVRRLRLRCRRGQRPAAPGLVGAGLGCGASTRRAVLPRVAGVVTWPGNCPAAPPRRVRLDWMQGPAHKR